MVIRACSLGLVGLVAWLFTASQPVLAQAETELTMRAYAAGYQAAFTCSATFNANKAPAATVEHELTGVYPLVQERLPELQAEVDRQLQLVKVSYDETMPPRVALWRAGLGCVHLPVGSAVPTAQTLAQVHAQLPQLSPALQQTPPQHDDGRPWVQRTPLNSSSGNSALDRVIAQAFTQHYGAGARTSAVLIATPSQIIAEHYLAGFNPATSQRTWSVAKSIGASIIGAAVQQQLVQVDQAAGLAQWQQPLDPRASITLENLLQMASGLDSNAAGNRTDRLYMGGGTVADTATPVALEAPPGQRWKYANNDTLLALRVLRESFTDVQDYLDFPYAELLQKIGMQHTFLETDWQGDYILSSQVWTTARDLARLGILHLQQGRWQGEQILPPNWLDYISSPASAQPPRSANSEQPRPGYGAQWWLFDEYAPALPADTIAARGNRGQYLFIIPSRQLVIVRRGYDYAGQPRFQEAEFAADVLRALDAASSN